MPAQGEEIMSQWLNEKFANACKKGHIKSAKLLLTLGADPNTYNKKTGRSVLSQSIVDDNKDVFEFLLPHIVVEFPDLVRAIKADSIIYLEQLLPKCSLPLLNQEDRHHMTPIMHAARENSITKTRLLLERKASVRNKAGFSAKTYASDAYVKSLLQKAELQQDEKALER